ncbi:MAG: S8 family serine peptidase [Bdellovibrionaceae bacterium]|nr:S8 family serine peptidase [Pseudobdellovibrionaceae bacterium]
MEQEFDIRMVDPAIKQKWGLTLTDSKKAWERHKVLGSRDIVVAVIDTGIDINHPDLKDNLWKNKRELKGKPGVDDDNNGYIDDFYGWNFVDENNKLDDNHGHGTHIAGIIGAVGGNGIGISGVAPRVSLMAIKYYDPKAPGRNNLMNTVRALKYAIDQGVDIINYSGGGLEPSPAEKKLIEEAHRKGILIVAAAGNEKSNSDIHGYFPADYDFDNIISVTAYDQSENILPTSNYGAKTVDIAAPGNNIYSTLPGGGYGYMTGTSQATAFVSGVAVLLKSRFTDFNAQKIIKNILENGNYDSKLAGKTRFQKRLNTWAAIAGQDRGVARTGVVAENTSNMNTRIFTNDEKFHETLEFQDISQSNTSNTLLDLSKAINKQFLPAALAVENNKL